MLERFLRLSGVAPQLAWLRTEGWVEDDAAPDQAACLAASVQTFLTRCLSGDAFRASLAVREMRRDLLQLVDDDSEEAAQSLLTVGDWQFATWRNYNGFWSLLTAQQVAVMPRPATSFASLALYGELQRIRSIAESTGYVWPK